MTSPSAATTTKINLQPKTVDISNEEVSIVLTPNTVNDTAKEAQDEVEEVSIEEVQTGVVVERSTTKVISRSSSNTSESIIELNN